MPFTAPRAPGGDDRASRRMLIEEPPRRSPPMSRLVLILTASSLLAPLTGGAQVVSEPRDTVVEQVDPGDVRGTARSAQSRFEIRRGRHLPRSRGGSSGPCDETVGRFCTWYDEGNWVPEPEEPEITEMRAELLTELDTLQPHAPGDGWILGQRVWYRAEAGNWPSALEVARSCGPPQEPWWCAALTGFALHGLERYPDAERAFDVSLWEMDLEQAWTWRVPVRAVDGDARTLLESLREAPTDSVERVLDRLWAFADPLYLAEGNDRKTEHFARWAVATLRDGARTPYGIRWGSDLEELLVRHGWEIGWERETDPWMTGGDRVVGHKHPEGRDYLPPGRVLQTPFEAPPEDLVADRDRPRSLYAPPYAPVILPIEGQVAVFPRGVSFLVVATHDLPADTTRHAREDRPRPWMEPEGRDTPPDAAGLYLVDAVTGRQSGSVVTDSIQGALTLEGGAGDHLLSVETWSPGRRLAGRFRMGLSHLPTPEDIPVLSDILLVTSGGEPPIDVVDAADRALPTASIEEGETLGIVWEVSGLGFRAEALSFDLSVERTDRGVLQRLGEFLGFGDRPQPLALRWQEAGPDEPGVFFRHLELDLPELSPGRYAVRLTLHSAGREPVATLRTFEVRAAAPR